MKENHHDVVRNQFSKQAPRFGEQGLTLSSPEHLQWVVNSLDLEPYFAVLDVAAGTGHLSRAIAPHVKQVVALDATAEMLLEGRHQAEQDGIGNILFEQGLAEGLPYPTDAFDMVISRFAIHHFVDPHVPIGEMVRVCRRGGKVAVVDLVSPENEALAAAYNQLERMRDSSHTKALSPSELKRLVEGAGLDIGHTISREIEVNVDRWLELTETSPEIGRAIVEELEQELKGLKATGMRPFLRDNELMFEQTWLIVVGEK
jgi:ubiquinone/menaquinone biosynthesis C-methylase UbiE